MATHDERLKIGTRFEHLTVSGEPVARKVVYKSGRQETRHFIKFKCDCGKIVEYEKGRFLKRFATSCGCWFGTKRRHGETRTKLYWVWLGMRSRCRDKNHKSFKRYGRRGIAVCDLWDRDYLAFKEWALSSGYREGLTIERTKNSGNYEPGNCTWIPLVEQGKNRRDNRHLAAFGETKLLSEWMKDPRCVVNRITLHSRLKAGCPIELAMSTREHGNKWRYKWASSRTPS